MSVFSMNITEVVRRYRGFIDYLRKERAWLLGLNKMNIVSKRHWGSYLEIILAKE